MTPAEIIALTTSIPEFMGEAAVRELERQGFKILSREPTEVMVEVAAEDARVQPALMRQVLRAAWDAA